MGERVADETTIAAGIDTVWDIITDLPSYPQWARGVVSTEVLSTDDDGRPHLGRFVVDARIAEFAYTIRYHYEDHDIGWQLVEGDSITQLDGCYALSTTADGTLVRFVLEVDLDLPLPGFMKNRAAKSILEQGLAGLKLRAESSG